MGHIMKMEVVLLFLMMTKVLTTDIQYDHRNQSLDNRCDVCMDVITDLDAWITSDKNLDEIVQYVQGICNGLDYIDPVWETLCLGLISDLLPEIILELVEYFLTPSEVCVKIGWCGTTSSTT